MIAQAVELKAMNTTNKSTPKSVLYQGLQPKL